MCVKLLLLWLKHHLNQRHFNVIVLVHDLRDHDVVDPLQCLQQRDQALKIHNHDTM